MKIKVICIGKTGKSFLVDGEQEYLKRLKHYTTIEKLELPDVKGAKNKSEDQIKAEEGLAILQKVAVSDQLYLLDEKGKEFSSEQFAEFIQKRFNQAMDLVFVIGGPYGFSEEIKNRSNGKIALSRMTFSHQMVRMIFLEQLYRGLTILKGEPYHHS